MNFSGIKGHRKQLVFLDRVSKNEIPHALLFSGQSGIGKRLIAERFIKSLYCHGAESPCLECEVCRQIDARSFQDFIVLERDDKDKIPVGQREKPADGTVRWLIDRLSRTPVTGRYSVLIDGVHTISDAGQNALLKTIEEPYSDALIIMIAEGSSGILSTILSRCVNITFNPLTDDDVMDSLCNQGVNSELAAMITAMSGGSLGNAIRLRDDKTRNLILEFASSLSGAVKRGNMKREFIFERTPGIDDSFLVSVLINIYGSVLRGNFSGEGSCLEGEILLDRRQVSRILKILLAIKKGENNNLNFRNILKGMFYSFDRIDTSLSVDPDFSWL